MKWFLLTWLYTGGLGISITPMPSKAVCQAAASAIVNYIHEESKDSGVLVKCIAVKP